MMHSKAQSTEHRRLDECRRILVMHQTVAGGGFEAGLTVVWCEDEIMITRTNTDAQDTEMHSATCRPRL